MTIAALLYLAALQAPAPSAAVTGAVSVSVVDKSGHNVPDLTAAEVVVKENGQSRELKRVERDVRPLALAVLLDSSVALGNQFRNELVDPVMDFLERLPPETDRTLITIGTPPEVVALQDPAQARAALKAKVPFGKIDLYDGLTEACGLLGAKKGMRRVVIVVTSEGFTDDDQAIARAAVAKASPLVLAIQFGPTGVYQPDLDGIVKWTGGRYEPIGAASGVGKLLQRFLPDLEAPWLVMYETPSATGKREVDVKVTRKGVKTRVRPAGLD